MTDSLELQRWRDGGKAPAGSCPFCASRISMIERDGRFRARCSHRGCGATGPLMTSITRAADVFCCPPHRTAGGMSARTLAAEADAARLRAHIDAAGDGANLPALLDLYHDRAERAEADAAKASCTIDAILDKLGARDTGTGGQTVEAGSARIMHDGMRRLERAIADAARWRKVAPLIEAMRKADASLDRDEMSAAVGELLAEMEPTP